MQPSHHHDHAGAGSHSHDHAHGHDDHGHDHGDATAAGRDHGDWANEEFVAGWLERQEAREPERRRQFAVIRALVTKRPGDQFSYLNLGAGPGNLDEVLLGHFPGANATLVDGSLPMLDEAQKRLARFGNRVEFVQADFGDADWTGAVSGPFDFVISTLAIHHLGDPARIRELYGEVFRLIGHGGLFLNMEFVRPARPSLAPLAAWAARDDEAGFSAVGPRHVMPGTLAEQLGWLAEAGFPCVDVAWKSMNVAVFVGVRDHPHIPDEPHEGDGHGHSHAH